MSDSTAEMELIGHPVDLRRGTADALIVAAVEWDMAHHCRNMEVELHSRLRNEFSLRRVQNAERNLERHFAALHAAAQSFYGWQ